MKEMVELGCHGGNPAFRILLRRAHSQEIARLIKLRECECRTVPGCIIMAKMAERRIAAGKKINQGFLIACDLPVEFRLCSGCLRQDKTRGLILPVKRDITSAPVFETLHTGGLHMGQFIVHRTPDRDEGVRHCFNQCEFARKVGVERSAADTRFLQDIIDSRAGVALSRKNPNSAIQQLRTCFSPLRALPRIGTVRPRWRRRIRCRNG